MTAKDFDELVDQLNTQTSFKYIDTAEILWNFRNTPTHDTPFNHGFFRFEVKAPIFVRAQLVKHEYLIMSEYSRRYITDDIEFYVPDVWRGAAKDKKQGSSGSVALDHIEGEYGSLGRDFEVSQEMALETYDLMVAAKVAPEQARMVLPQSLMTAWTWSGSFGAFANMCKLRLAPDSQYETRLVAEVIYKELEKQFPVSAGLIVKGVF